jgi:hypothetical protein
MKVSVRYPTIFHLLSTEFKKAKISCVLIGGFAVNYYGATRHTADVDFLISTEDSEKASKLLRKAGFKQSVSQDVFARFGDNRSYFMDIDFMFVDKETLGEITREGKKAKVAGKEFIVPSLNHLIALKLHSIKFNPIRELTDLPDVVRLIQVNKVNVLSSGFKELCLKYGTKELYDRILGHVE